VRTLASVAIDDAVHGLGGIVGHGEEAQIVRGDHPLGQQRPVDPAEHRIPVRAAEKDDREVPDLASLDQRERLEELIERPEPAREDDESLGRLHEHRLAGIEVVKRVRDIQERVRRLFVRELDVEADREAAGLLCSAVRRLHQPRPASGHHREPFPGETRSDLGGERAPAIGLGEPGGAEDRDGRPIDASHGLESGAELLGDLGDVTIVVVGFPLQHRLVVHAVTVSGPRSGLTRGACVTRRVSTCSLSEGRSTVDIEMTKLIIRLPTAAPQAYVAWVTWWRDVEQLLGSDTATAIAAGDDDGQAPDREARSIVLEHVRSLEEQAKQASEEGKETISPELSAEPAEWDQWLDYWRSRREWLEALALREIPEPKVPEDLVTLWERTLQMIGVELAIDMADLHNLKVLGTGTSGSIRLVGELEVMNVDAVGRHLEEELRTGKRLSLDLSGLTFIDSRGLAMLLQLSELANELDLIPIVLKTSEVVRRVMEVGLPAPIPGVEIEP
jgi:anti-anti-sigma factor